MTNKELKEKLANISEDKYIYQRYDGRITKYKVSGEYYINVEGGIAINKNRQLLVGKISENLIDLVEVTDIVNGVQILDITGEYIRTRESIHNKNWLENNVKTILTHELYEANCYKV